MEKFNIKEKRTLHLTGIRSQEAIFLSIVILFWFAQYVYIPYQTPYLLSIGITSHAVGMVIGAYGISQMLLRFPVGLWADKIGKHKRFILIGTFASGSASLLRIFMYNGTGFFIANLISGVASATWISFMVFYTDKYSVENQQKATSRIVMFFNIGMLFGFIASAFCYSTFGMNMLCILSSISGFLAFFFSFFIIEPSSDKCKIGFRQLVKVCTSKPLIMFSIVALVQQGIQMATTMSFTNQILKEQGGSDLMVGFSSIIYMLSAVFFAGVSSSNFFTKKGSKFWIPVVLLIVAVYCALVPTVTSIPVLLLLQILPGISTGILFSYATTEAMRGVAAKQKSTAMGFFQAIYAIGMTSFPVFVGKLAANSGIQISYLVLSCIAVLCCISVIFFFRFNKTDTKI